MFRPLDARNEHFRLQIRILREKSYPEPAGKLPNPEPRSKYDQNYCFNKLFDCIRIVFPMFCLLGSGFGYFWPQIRILREISSLEPAPKVKIPEFRSENDEIYFLMCFFLIASWGYIIYIRS